MFAERRDVIGTGAVIVVALISALVSAGEAAAQVEGAVPSDPRADFFEGNVTECSQVGFRTAVQLSGEEGLGSTTDGLVTGTVDPPIPSEDYTRLQVAITDAGGQAGVVIRAVVVKGGDGHNVYTDTAFLPPTLQPPQDYISPNVHGHPADISHWFICYELVPPEPPRRHSLRVVKRLELPVGVPVTSLPTEYRVRVTCRLDEEIVRRRTFTFGAGGGSGTTETGARRMIVPEGATCRVRELNTDALPEGCDVSYEPPRAEDPGITVPDDGRRVTVVNDCQDVPVRRAGLDIVKRIVGFAPGELPDSFLVDVECTDGTAAQVTVPASGEPGTPRLNGIRVGEYCLVTERTGSLPPGLQVTYTINGSPSPLPGAADFQVVGDGRITVTITNTRSTTPPAPPPPEVPGEPAPNLDFEKTVRPVVVRAGGLVRYTIEVRNRGRGLARRVDVCDRLPRAMTLVSAPGSRFRNGRICWRIRLLRPLASRRFALTARANLRASGPTINVATAAAPGARQRTARAWVTILRRRALAPAVTG